MRRKSFRRVTALALTLCLTMALIMPAYAAGRGNNSWGNPGKGNNGWGTSVTPTTSTELTLIEDETTVEEGTELRADTYSLTTTTTTSTSTSSIASRIASAFGLSSSNASQASSTYAGNARDTSTTTTEETTLKYFPVTLYNYDGRMNSATHQAEVNAALADGDISKLPTTWQGIYFGCAGITDGFYYETGEDSDTAYVKVDITFDDDGNPQIDDGDYLIVSAASMQVLSGAGTYTEGTGWDQQKYTRFSSSTTMSKGIVWTITKSGDAYTVANSNKYMTIDDKTANYTSGLKTVVIGKLGDGISLGTVSGNTTYYLNLFGGSTSNGYAGWTGRDDNSKFYLYKKSNGFAQIDARGYANWNKFTGDLSDGIDSTLEGNRTYSGLVSSSLDANKNIQFTKPDGGIFSADATMKDVYTNVGLPFEYDEEKKYYTFDAGSFGAYFQGTPKSNTNLHYDSVPQGHNATSADKRDVGWFPFNDTTDTTASERTTTGVTSRKVVTTPDYYFGMNATIPFTMTANGKIDPNDKTSSDIVFSFSGDDDVWVFIDGELVLDMGGCRNCMNAEINFAENTWAITPFTGDSASDYNGANMSGTIFNETTTASDGTTTTTTGTLNQTRETFAASDTHELTIFYLERGAGSSNCKIEFNLPMKDVVSVTKRATQSIAQDGNITPLTAKEQETVNNIDFGFTLTKNSTPVANANYNLLNANGQVISTPSTDANGHFTLRNGQTAKFIGEIAADGAEYQVVEDIPNNVVTDDNGETLYTFSQAIYTYGGTAAGGYTVGGNSYEKGSNIPETKVDITTADSIASAAVTAKGSIEAEDSLQFICENFFNANLPNPSSRPVDDQIVIDYGLSVIIDPLANDVYRGDTIELTGEVTGAQYGTANIQDGKITYQLTKQLTGVEVLTYTATVTGSGNEGTDSTTASESNTANIYIIPATSMYYEENFGNLVTYTNNGDIATWKSEGTAQDQPQEPGVVGTVGDSPYGSDAAYLNDSGDSNGSSKYVNTASSAASFSYTFTGTGTSFFARTTNNSGYMKVVITDTDKDNQTVYTGFRDTSYKTEDYDTTLYNIPVFTYEADNYGTYTVTVSIAGGNNANNYGKEFWLDGIRVISPLNSNDDNVSVANSAYATDGEANMTVATLRQKLLSNATTVNEDGSLVWSEYDEQNNNFVLFTDSNGTIKTADEYKSNGPKEEVYLAEGQSVTFSLTNWDPNTNKIYLGIKAPTGSGAVNINDNTEPINNATDCYYDISSYAKITTDEDNVQTATFKITASSSLISVTNIKVTGSAQFTIVNETDETTGGDGSN